MFTDDDADIFDHYDLIQTARTLNHARVERQRELLQLLGPLPSRELIEDARLLLKLASIRAADEVILAARKADMRPTLPPRSHHKRRPGRPRKVHTPPLHPDVATLHALRLERDWPYRVLAEEVRKTGEKMSLETLRNVLTGARTPHPNTLAVIQRFLAAQAKQAPPLAEEPAASGEATH